MKPVHMCAAHQWEKILTKVNRAVIFLDNAVAEMLHWHGGLVSLLQAGAVEVKELSSFESVAETQKKAVFIVSSLLKDVTADIIRDILLASRLQYVIVMTIVSPQVHIFDETGVCDGDDRGVFHAFEEKLLEWMCNMNYTAEVEYTPLSTASVTPSLFVMPSFTDLFPLLESDVKQIELQLNRGLYSKADRKVFDTLSEIEASHLPQRLQTTYKKFTSAINGLLDELDVRDDCYSVGPTSRLLATELESYAPARQRRKSKQNRASLLLIDRSLDLASIGYQPDTLLDKMVSILPRLPGHNNDLLVNMADVCCLKIHANNDLLVPGCLSHSDDTTAQQLLNTMAIKKQKEALMSVNRHLVEAAAEEKLPIKLAGKPGRVSADQLQTTIELFKGNYKAIRPHSGILQLAMATSQALTHPINSHHDNLLQVEKLMVQNLFDPNGPSAVFQVMEILKLERKKGTSDRVYSLDDILHLLLFVYSLAGEDCADSEAEERRMQSLFIHAILEDREKLPPIIQSMVGQTVTPAVVTAIVEDAWSKLKAVSLARNDLKQFRSLLDPGSAVSPGSYKSLLKQVVEEIFNPNKPELIDVEFKSSGLKDFLKSGFGLFRSVSKPRPNDHPVVIIFVIGGITSSEVKQIKDTVASLKSDCQVIVGSTRLVQPQDILQYVMCQDRLNPENVL